MSVQWMTHGHRLDAELAVAFEMGHRNLVAARSPSQLDRAIAYNLKLWRTARRLAMGGEAVIVRDDVADSADLVATLLVTKARPFPDRRDVDFVAGRDLAIARELAAGMGAEQARDTLIAEWSAGGQGRFEEWLLAKVEGLPS